MNNFGAKFKRFWEKVNSAKFRITMWFTVMVLLMAIIVLVFVLVINHHSISDEPTARLVQMVQKNQDNLEFDHGRYEWDDVDLHRRGVYSIFYDEDGNVLQGAMLDDWGELGNIPFEANVIRTVTLNDSDYFIYDAPIDMEINTVWVRGVVDTEDNSGLMHIIMVLMWTLIPGILILSIGGGWLLAWLTFRPMDKIMNTVDGISQGEDLSLRVNMKRGPTEMKRLSRAFDHMFDRLEVSFNAERQFASDVSHELRTPITVILAECSRAKRKKKDLSESIDVIEEQAQGMSELVQSLLSLTRMQQGTDRYPMRKGNLGEFAESCCDEFMPAQERGITLERDIAENVIVPFNPALMSRVVQNLLQNAYKYGKENGHIKLSVTEDNDFAYLRVADDGIGIAQENLDKIWQRFWQADASRGEEGSSGLGLAMVKEIAQFHGGDAGVESILNTGSTFTVKLPKGSA